MLTARDGAGRLPNGYLPALVERTGKSRRELGYRVQFAETYETEEELSNALDSPHPGARSRSHSRPNATPTTTRLPSRRRSSEGKFSTFVVDPPWRYGNTSTRGAREVLDRSDRSHVSSPSRNPMSGRS